MSCCYPDPGLALLMAEPSSAQTTASALTVGFVWITAFLLVLAAVAVQA